MFAGKRNLIISLTTIYHISTKYELCTGERGVACTYICVKSEAKLCSLTRNVITEKTYEQRLTFMVGYFCQRYLAQFDNKCENKQKLALMQAIYWESLKLNLHATLTLSLTLSRAEFHTQE